MKPLSTQLQIKNAKAGVYSVTGASGFGFKKESDTPGGGSYTVRYRFGGRRPTMGLGAFSEISLVDAREAAKDAVKLARKGINPIEARSREKAANLAAERAKRPITFAQAAEDYCKLRAPLWKHKYAARTFLNPIVKYAYPVVGALSPNDIAPEHIAAIRAAADRKDPETNKSAPEAGKRVQTKIRKILAVAIAKGYRDRLRGNPADAELMEAFYPTAPQQRPNFRRIPLDDAPMMLRALRQAQEAAAGYKSKALDAWLMMIATAARPGEAVGARWSEIDLDHRLWTVPAMRMKSNREHAVPLSALALEVLERRRLEQRLKGYTGDAVFPGQSGSPIGYAAFARAPAEVGVNAGTPHSWRSLFSDWAGDIGRVDPDLSEAALAHTLGKVRGAYRRQTAIEARRPVMEAYAKWLCGDAGADILAFPTSSRA